MTKRPAAVLSHDILPFTKIPQSYLESNQAEALNDELQESFRTSTSKYPRIFFCHQHSVDPVTYVVHQ